MKAALGPNARRALCSSLLLCAVPGYGQFLRVGPFDFDAKAHLDAIYTTNVEKERKSESVEDRKDFYTVLGLDAVGKADVSPRTSLSLEAGVAVESHINRPDLNEQDLGHVRLRTMTEFARIKVETHAEIQKDAESTLPTTFVPGGGGTERKVSTTTGYGALARWDWRYFYLSDSYDFERERYAKEKFQHADQDKTTLDFIAGVKLKEGLSVEYEKEQKLIVLPNDPVAKDEWLTTETIDIVFDRPFELWRRPHITYRFGLEKEDTAEEKGQWQIRHTLTMEDEYDFSRALRLIYGAMYEYEDQEETTDISLTYNARLEQDLGRTARHFVAVRREPASTFGSTKETDQTEWDYNFSKQDLFIYALNFMGNVSYTIDRPLDATIQEERTTEYTLQLGHSYSMSRRLTRSLLYEYSWEKSDLKPEILDEHRVTLRYTYDL